MKKKSIIALTIGFSVAALFGLSACTSRGGSLFGGASDKRYAYDVAVERGEEGSRESWLASQEAPETELHRLYEEAYADGSFTGTFFEFLQALGVQNDNGAYVQSALRSVVSIEATYPASRFTAWVSSGAGVVYSLDTAAGDALIVTNFHVVYDRDIGSKSATIPYVSEDIQLYPYGWEYAETGISATYVGGSAECDIAVLKVENCSYFKETASNHVPLQELVAADSDNLSAGERVYAIGNAAGMGMSVTEGVVSVDLEYAYFQAADGNGYVEIPEIRTDAAVNHGNSGGGLFNAAGELVGIVNGRAEEDGVLGFGYAIPANYALSAAQNIIDNCLGTQSYKGAAARLGIDTTVTDSRAYFDARTGKFYIEEKVAVSAVSSSGLAAGIGFLSGDTLVSAKLSSARGEREVQFTRSVKWQTFLLEIRRGDTVTFTVSRGGQTLEFSYTFAANSDFRTLQ